MTTILIIEDEPVIRNNIVRIIAHQGFKAIAAENGMIGVQMIRQTLPDLIICDIMMPGLNGYEVLDIIRQDPETALIPFIFLSAKSDRTDQRDGMNLGADDYLTKPFTSGELINTITARLEKQGTLIQLYRAEMQRATSQLNQMAYVDPLTGLPNRISLYQMLQRTIQSAQKDGMGFALLCIMFCQERSIQQSCRLSDSEQILEQVVDRLQETVRSPNCLARLGGDCFALLLTPLHPLDNATAFTQSLLTHLYSPYSLEHQDLFLQFNIGIALYPQDGDMPDHLLTRAELACQWSQDKTTPYALFQPSMLLEDAAERQLSLDLKAALDRQEFCIYYQPQVNLITRRIIGIECLLRWKHPTRGLLLPQDFLKIAENTGLILALNEWVLLEACQQVKEWQSLSMSPLKVSVNLSARHLRDAHLGKSIARILEQVNFDPKLLVLEVSEAGVMTQAEAAIAILQPLAELGIEIAIDDFGTGFSSLSHLQRLPISSLKIDHSLINRVTDDENDAAVISAIIAVAQSLNLRVIAEGVETQAQLDFLRKRGCYAIQGYFHSYPLPAPDFEKTLTLPQTP